MLGASPERDSHHPGGIAGADRGKLARGAVDYGHRRGEFDTAHTQLRLLNGNTFLMLVNYATGETTPVDFQ